ncbi:MAG: glycosyltransferase, partial [Candidatus Marinimicrobia bacterium]|nr:glycosyltransferase [Candidatus Neomarinimicrobiota bacterium]
MVNSLVIIPTYNERENVATVIKKLNSLNTGVDILVVDDNSPDGTAEIVKGLQKECKNL